MELPTDFFGVMRNKFMSYLSEEDLTHRAIIDFIQLKYGRYRKFLAHPANEGKRSAFEQFKIVYLGVSPGLPDLMMFLPRGKYNGLAIEVKARGKQPTDAQLKWLDNLENHCGWMARWVDDIETAMKLIDLYFSEKPYRFIDPQKETAQEEQPHPQ